MNQIDGLILEPKGELAHQTYNICTDLCWAESITPLLLLVGSGCGREGDNSNAIIDRATMLAVTHDLHGFVELHSGMVMVKSRMY